MDLCETRVRYTCIPQLNIYIYQRGNDDWDPWILKLSENPHHSSWETSVVTWLFAQQKKCGCSGIFIKNQDGSSKSLTQREHPTFIVFLTSRRYAWENFYGYQIPPCIAQYQAVAKQSPRFIHNLFIPYYCLDARCLYEFVKLTMVSRLYPPGFRAWIWLDTFLPGSGRKNSIPGAIQGWK